MSTLKKKRQHRPDDVADDGCGFCAGKYSVQWSL